MPIDVRACADARVPRDCTDERGIAAVCRSVDLSICRIFVDRNFGRCWLAINQQLFDDSFVVRRGPSAELILIVNRPQDSASHRVTTLDRRRISRANYFEL
jgi:hypothetical protein